MVSGHQVNESRIAEDCPMSLRELTSREAVLSALHEFDFLGRDEFLQKYGFHPARSYFVRYDGKLYDSKAIVGAAHGHEHGKPLKPSDFSGGANTVQPLLEKLGFDVVVGVPEEMSSDLLPRRIKMIEDARQEAESAGAFHVEDLEDARRKTLAKIVQRQGQREFRTKLINAYEGRCAVTGCDVLEALEAAHIYPYMGQDTNVTKNGLLLRADIHTLFDLGKLTVDAETMEVLLERGLKETKYGKYQGQKIYLPTSEADRPDKDALNWHNQQVVGIVRGCPLCQ